MTSAPTHEKRHQREHRQRKEETAAAQRQRLERERIDIGEQMGTEAGRRNAYRMLNRAGLIYGDAAVEENLRNTTVTLMTAAVARRQVAWRFDQIVRRHFNHLWLQMLEENES